MQLYLQLTMIVSTSLRVESNSLPEWILKKFRRHRKSTLKQVVLSVDLTQTESERDQFDICKEAE